jgi:4-oxalocrotonate tautomerase
MMSSGPTCDIGEDREGSQPTTSLFASSITSAARALLSDHATSRMLGTVDMGSKWLPILKETEMPVVRVSWFAGKDAKAKKAVAAEITESIVKNTGTDAKYIYVLFEDIAPSDWAGAGKLFGEEPEKS